MIKLSIGAGYKREPGWVHVDKEPATNPDKCFDLEWPWPFDADSVEEVRAHHVIEHVGETTAGFFSFIKELYRVCVDDAKIDIHVPHHQHRSFAARQQGSQLAAAVSRRPHTQQHRPGATNRLALREASRSQNWYHSADDGFVMTVGKMKRVGDDRYRDMVYYPDVFTNIV
jgi:predicted SAM-dependent methyltransferase